MHGQWHFKMKGCLSEIKLYRLRYGLRLEANALVVVAALVAKPGEREEGKVSAGSFAGIECGAAVAWIPHVCQEG